MAMTIDTFDAVTLSGIIELRKPKWDLFASFFKPQSPSDRDMFELHTRVHGESCLPTVTLSSAGVMRQPEEWSIGVVKAPRFRTKRGFSAADVVGKRQFGFTAYDAPDSVQSAVAQDMDLHRLDHDRMIEIMCAQACIEGKVTLYNNVEGVKTASFTVDYKRPSSHEITLTSAQKWSASTSDLWEQFDNADYLIQQDADGLAATDIVMGKNAWAAFRHHADVVDFMDTRYNIGSGELPAPLRKYLKGIWNGLNVHVYNGSYTDILGQKTNFIGANDCVVIASGAQSVIEYGRPVDTDCGGACTYFCKQIKLDDPSGIFTIAESRPLPVTRHAGWTVLLKSVV